MIGEEIERRNGFIVVKLTQEERDLIGWGLNEKEYVCAHCGQCKTGDAYYVPVLYDMMCEECLEKWVTSHTPYKEDEAVEYRNYLRLKRLLDESL